MNVALRLRLPLSHLRPQNNFPNDSKNEFKFSSLSPQQPHDHHTQPTPTMTFSTTSAYTAKQIDHYLDYISFPQELRSAQRNAHFLKVLHTHQISKIPYDNLSLHYSASHNNNIDPQVLFEKFTNNGRGGYCMEQTIFYRNILLGLGFDTYSAGARIRLRQGNVPVGDFIGWYVFIRSLTLTLYVKFGPSAITEQGPLRKHRKPPNR